MPFSVGLLGTFPPTQCGLATFAASLARELGTVGVRCGVVRLADQPETTPSDGVIHHLVRGSVPSICAGADALNTFDVAIIQHEFGIFGGPDGDEVLDVLARLRVPVVTVLHTVLGSPTRHEREVLEEVVERANVIVTMTEAACARLVRHYRVDPDKVTVIPHGAPGPEPIGPATRRGGPPTILTWGLIGPGKGIEAVIDILPGLAQYGLLPHYRVVGQTHPKVIEHSGESYRDRLVARALAAGVASQLEFDARYLDSSTLHQVVAAADIVVLPYESREQVTSGVLTEAIAAGKPVVATAFPHAVELLGQGGGLVVPHDDPDALALALRRILSEPGLAASMADRASVMSADLLWSTVTARYRELIVGLAGLRTAA